MVKNIDAMKEDGLKTFSEKVDQINTDTTHLKSLDDALFSSKGETQVEIARRQLQEQKKNPLFIKPYKKVDTRSEPPTSDRFRKLREHLNERVDVLINRTDLSRKPIEFGLGLLPGEPYNMWKIPVGEVISIPRGVMLHLKNNCVWVKIDFREKPMHEKAKLQDLSIGYDPVVDSISTEFQILDAKAL